MKHSFSTSSARLKLHGQGVSRGVSIGHVRLFQVSTLEVGESVVIEGHIEHEIERFQEALNHTRQQIQELGQRVEERGEDKSLTEVLNMHLLLLEDRMIVERVAELIREHHYGAEYALTCVYRESEKRYAGLPDLFRERFKDVEDICRRIMNNLRGVQTISLEDLSEESIIISKDLAPSDTASMRSETVLGFVTEVGGKTSHTAILARALEIPAIVGVTGITRFVKDDDLVILDATRGEIIINPTDDELTETRDRIDEQLVRQSRLISMSEVDPVTLDGHVIDLAANIEFASEVETIAKYGARGVGLFRTEFLFLNRISIPSEEEQFEHYNEVASRLAPDPVIVRTLDIGGDKFAQSLDTHHELNPYLGCRAIRFSLTNLDLFRTQLRAILRASASKNVRIMYPLVSNLQELLDANRLLEEVKTKLHEENIEFDEEIPVGAMIEVPSAVMIAEDLAPHLDFFSIGTNDLIQYVLAVDRGNEQIAHLYQPLHPAVLRMIAMVVRVGQQFGIPVSVCGEMASDPVTVLVLLSMGVERLSMAPSAIPIVKDLVRNCQLVQLREFGCRIIARPSANDIQQLIAENLHDLIPNHIQLIDEHLFERMLTGNS